MIKFLSANSLILRLGPRLWVNVPFNVYKKNRSEQKPAPHPNYSDLSWAPKKTGSHVSDSDSGGIGRKQFRTVELFGPGTGTGVGVGGARPRCKHSSGLTRWKFIKSFNQINYNGGLEEKTTK